MTSNSRSGKPHLATTSERAENRLKLRLPAARNPRVHDQRGRPRTGAPVSAFLPKMASGLSC